MPATTSAIGLDAAAANRPDPSTELYKRMDARYPGKCACCNGWIVAGTRVRYYPNRKRITHLKCPAVPEAAPVTLPPVPLADFLMLLSAAVAAADAAQATACGLAQVIGLRAEDMDRDVTPAEVAHMQQAMADAAKAREHADKLKARRTEIRMGDTVEVVSGYKVMVGTVGKVMWLGEGRCYDADNEVTYKRVGLKDADGTVHFTSAKNLTINVYYRRTGEE